MTTTWYRWDGDDLILRVRVQPRSSNDGFAEVIGDMIKLRLTAPPVDGKANAYLKAYLARCCRTPKSAIQIEAGQANRAKRIRITAPRILPPGIARP